MSNRKLIRIIAAFAGGIMLMITLNLIFSVRSVNAFSVNLPPSNSIVIDRNNKISKSIKKGTSLLFSKNKLAKRIEEDLGFSDVSVVDIEKRVTGVAYINYFVIVRHFEIFSNEMFYRVSNDGKVLDVIHNSEHDLDSSLIRVLGDINIDNAVAVSDNIVALPQVRVISDIAQAFYDNGFLTGTLLAFVESISLEDYERNGNVYINTTVSGSTFIINTKSDVSILEQVTIAKGYYDQDDDYKYGIITVDGVSASWRDRREGEKYDNNGNDWAENA